MLAAMKQVLGTHLSQKGSFLNDEMLRFDFSHFAKVSDEELRRIETIVNTKIRANIPLKELRNVPIKEALAMGANATFGEKYGDFVRVITFEDGFSVELCGGTHLPATGEIGLFKFVSEGSVSAGVRRVEALTGEKALELIRNQDDTLSAAKDLLKGPADLIKAIQALIDEKSGLQKRVEQLENEKLQTIKTDLQGKISSVGGLNLLVDKVEVPSADGLKQLAYHLKGYLDNLVIVLGTDIGGKPQLAVLIDEQLVKDRNLHAGQIVKDLAKEIRGGGGGQPFFATAGGSDSGGLDKALDKARSLFS